MEKSKLKHNKKILKHLKIHNEFPQSGGREREGGRREK
jgi:hypothetical protein